MIKAKTYESPKSLDAELETCFYVLCHHWFSYLLCSFWLQSLPSIQHRGDVSKFTRSICHVVIVLIKQSLYIFPPNYPKLVFHLAPWRFCGPLWQLDAGGASFRRCPLACALDSARDLGDPNEHLLIDRGYHGQKIMETCRTCTSSFYSKMIVESITQTEKTQIWVTHKCKIDLDCLWFGSSQLSKLADEIQKTTLKPSPTSYGSSFPTLPFSVFSGVVFSRCFGDPSPQDSDFSR